MTITIQPSSIDTELDSFAPTVNYGTATTVRLYGSVSHRGLIKFDLSSIPTGAAVLSATLSLNFSTVDVAGTINAYRVYRAWTEAGATWNKYDGTNNWGTAGCDNTTSDRSAVSMGSVITGLGWKSISLDLTEFASLRASNNGLLLLILTVAGYSTFYSREYAGDTSLCPKLIVELSGQQVIMF